MFQLKPSKRFTRKIKKLFKRNAPLKRRVKETLEVLSDNPQNKKLESYKVIAIDGGEAFSSRVTGDLRIIWRYSDEAGEKELQIISLVDIGGHFGAKKVYR